MAETSDALVIIDLQNGVCKSEELIYNFHELVRLVNHRVAQYQKDNKAIIIIQHCDETLLQGSYEWEVVPELNIPTNVHKVIKTHADSFFKTNFQSLLKKLKVTEMEICGAQTEYCIDTTIKVAHALGYHIQMQHGATTTYDNPYMHAQATINFYEGIWHQRFVTFIN
ncbi:MULTISPECIES: isochorismatase family protein [unclassified Enterococcus]|uniref:isochorismatase family protein n=1 Tax=unclassified Enterococcus TaxID=2608891 RepID=UPI001557EA03|nr:MULTISPECIES: isochorismatase family protein [unclassified Enterococcus]MBS7576318.1 isochorismatase family protein [Enterococcus sp. MMGLQ5-2]MBS7583551.1 isochorismatase family protein [Enterococcus sp. MMGLQ5-1]NPD11413.1 isochorismatase family protein [Enterococcus sp. MMGLQ5-1]NPD36156.1 isochorismatase family protein [Enterococcus sp. MMGLQ5-2]